MQPVRHLNVFQSIFGTSPLVAIFNSALLLALAYLLWKFIMRPLLGIYVSMQGVRSSRGRALTFLEIMPPARSAKNHEATEALYTSLHGMLAMRAPASRFMRQQQTASLELVSSRQHGIRFVAALDPRDVDHFKQLLISYLPTVRMREVEDYLRDYRGSELTRALEFVSATHFAAPLHTSDDFSQHDPVRYLTGALTRPVPDELLAFQIVMSPAQARKRIRSHAEQLPPGSQDKLGQPLFSVGIRALAIGPHADERLSGIRHALHQFHEPGFQGLVPRKALPGNLNNPEDGFRFRSPSMLSLRPTILSVSELTALYHFPFDSGQTTEGLVRSLHASLPAPLPFSQRADKGENSIVLGINHFHGQTTPVGLLESEREKHVYIIGGTGNGKTTLMLSAMLQDIQAGRGVAFIDPHGDAAETLLRHIPKTRLKDVVYLNPRDISHPVAINLLELPKGLSPDEYILEQERITEAVVGILRKLFADDTTNAHRIESMLRNAVRTALTVPDATLFTVLKLLRNSSFRNSVVKQLKDDDLKDFWIEEFNHAGAMQRVSMTKGLTARLDRFRSSAPVYRTFSQEQSTVSFEEIINSGKILICNFSNDMGEDTSALFGTSVLALLKIAAERRIKLPEASRRPFYVYVDEFQNFATQPFIKMLSSSRKYKLFLTIAEQSTAQQEEVRLTEAILANVGTVVAFRTGSPADERLLLPWFTPFIEEGDINNLPAHHFYLRVRANEPIEPVTAETQPLEDGGDTRQAAQVIATSRKRYGTAYSESISLMPQKVVEHKKHIVPVQEPVRSRIPRSAK